jgi:stage II sporulation protein D (peptidoglycan lytic transglycosylase)
MSVAGIGLSLLPTRTDTAGMKWSIPPLLVAGAVMALCCASSSTEPLAVRPAYRPPSTIRVRGLDRATEVTRDVPLEDYVEATVLTEFAPAAGDEAIVESMLEVQAVISRTYALAHVGRHSREGFDLCSTTHCQLYEPGRLRTSRWAAAAAEAVRHTSGQILWYDGAPADALFHADCGGRTSTAADVWGGPNPPYLRELDDDGPASGAHVSWRYEAPAETVRQALNADPRTRVGRRLRGLDVVMRDPSGRAKEIAIEGDLERIVRTEDFREVLARAFGPRAVRSNRLDISINASRVVFSGKGFGHGVGLCQAGAFARLSKGAKPKEVLSYYFPGIKIGRID